MAAPFLGHRHPCTLSALCANEYRAGAAVEIINGQRRDLVAPRAGLGQHRRRVLYALTRGPWGLVEPWKPSNFAGWREAPASLTGLDRLNSRAQNCIFPDTLGKKSPENSDLSKTL